MAKKNSSKTKEKKPRKSKKVKKEGPKKALSGFMFFSSERRKTLKEEKPDLKITEASVLIGAEWKKLTDTEKEPYMKLAQEDKVRYDREKKKTENGSEEKKKPKKYEEEDDDDEEEEEKEEDDDDDEED